MQRIDEKTYIDDTLVTCAEYQLFIDEMREQGKYYQPDHWTSCQFPKGQAREPVLGIRHSDAVAFCEWLTKQETGDWRYRLPKKVETKKYLIRSDQFILPFGYWIISVGNQLGFEWIGSIQDNPRKLDIDQGRALIRARETLDIALDLIRSTHGHDRVVFACELIRDRRDVTIARNYELARTSAFNLSRADDNVLNLVLDRGLFNLDLIRASVVDRALNLTSRQTRIRPSFFDFGGVYANTLALDYSLSNARKQLFNSDDTLKHILPRNTVGSRQRADTHDLVRASALDLVRAIDDASSSALDLYLEVFTLRERIAGRSPAFEGIRLVKERIR